MRNKLLALAAPALATVVLILGMSGVTDTSPRLPSDSGRALYVSLCAVGDGRVRADLGGKAAGNEVNSCCHEATPVYMGKEGQLARDSAGALLQPAIVASRLDNYGDRMVAGERRREVPIAEPGDLNVQYQYYDVRATSLEGLRAQIGLLGPQVKDRRFAGSARWNVSWRGDLLSDGTIANLGVTYSAIVTLPRWLNHSDAPTNIANGWVDFIVALEKHERGHVQIVADNVAALAATMRSSRATENKMRELFAAEIARIDRMQQDYDAATDHGAKQGAVY